MLMVNIFRKRLEKKGLPITDYYGVERLHIGQYGDPRFKKLTIKKVGQTLDKIITERKERGLRVWIKKSPIDDKSILVVFEPHQTEEMRKRYSSFDKWNKDTGKYAGHAIEINTKTGIITYELANRGTSRLTEKQRKEYMRIFNALRKIKS
jgi:hypothetical protein